MIISYWQSFWEHLRIVLKLTFTGKDRIGMILLEIRDKLNEAQEAAAKAELVLTEAFDEIAINENIAREDLMQLFKPEVIEKLENQRIINWICGSGQICRKLDIVTDYLAITKITMQDVEKALEECDISAG